MKTRIALLGVLAASVASHASAYADSATAHFGTIAADSAEVGGALIGIGALAVGIVFLVRLLRRGQP